ncbi:MAG: DUF6232 family protein [Cyanobacteria bacterium P01_G01_bin.39]
MEYAYIIIMISVTSAIVSALSFYNFVDKSILSKKQLEENDKYKIYLGKKVLKTSQAIYSLDGIESIQIVRQKPGDIIGTNTLVFSLFMGTLMLAVSINHNYWIILIVIFLYFIAFFAIIERIKKPVNYGLLMQTNTGETVFLSSDVDNAFLTKIISLIYEIMNDEGKTNSYIIDFQNRSIKKSNGIEVEIDNLNINE